MYTYRILYLFHPVNKIEWKERRLIKMKNKAIIFTEPNVAKLVDKGVVVGIFGLIHFDLLLPLSALYLSWVF